MNRLKSTLAPMFAASMLASAAHAGPVTPVISYTNGSQFNTTGISSLVNGSEMGGLSVTACFAGRGCEIQAWASLGTSRGGVVGSDWSLGLNGDSFSANFVLLLTGNTAPLVSLSMNGRPGLTTFDVVEPDPASPGSDIGKPFTLEADPGGFDSLEVAYTDKLWVDGVAYNDLYTVMTMSFSGGLGFRSGQMEFRADTDKILGALTAVPGGTVPTPGTLALVGLGLLGLAGQARRKSTS